MESLPEALQLLVEDLELNHEYCPKEVILQAAAELRRLHATNQELLEALKTMLGDTEESVYMTGAELRKQARKAVAKAEALK